MVSDLMMDVAHLQHCKDQCRDQIFVQGITFFNSTSQTLQGHRILSGSTS
jgi:hypothetical protein